MYKWCKILPEIEAVIMDPYFISIGFISIKLWLALYSILLKYFSPIWGCNLYRNISVSRHSWDILDILSQSRVGKIVRCVDFILLMFFTWCVDFILDVLIFISFSGQNIVCLISDKIRCHCEAQDLKSVTNLKIADLHIDSIICRLCITRIGFMIRIINPRARFCSPLLHTIVLLNFKLAFCLKDIITMFCVYNSIWPTQYTM